MGKGTRETDTDMFDQAVEHLVEVAILEETRDEILELCRQEGWEVDEGLRIVLAYGLAHLRGERELLRLNASDADLASELAAKAQQIADYHAMYSVMKFKAFKLLQVDRTLEMNVAGLRGELNLAHHTISHLREKVEALEAENVKLGQRLAAVESSASGDGAELAAEDDDPLEGNRPSVVGGDGVLTRLRHWLAGFRDDR